MSQLPSVWACVSQVQRRIGLMHAGNDGLQNLADAINTLAASCGLVGRIEVVAHDSLTMESAKKHLEGAYALRHRESCYQLAAGRDIVMESTPTIDSIDAWIDLLTQMTGGTR